MKRDILKQNTSIVVSVLACALGLLAVSMVWFNVEADKNFLSIEVGVLASIATVLIAWQLFTIFNLQKTVDGINESVGKKIKEAIEECRVQLEGEIAYIRANKWKEHAQSNHDNSAFELSYGYYLDALECFIKYPKAYYHEELVGYIEDIVKNGNINDWLSEKDKLKGVCIISKANAPKKHEVLKLLYNVSTDNPPFPNIELHPVMDKTGYAHKLIIHNTGDGPAYFFRVGLVRKSDEESVSLRSDDPSRFDKIDKDQRIIIHVIPKDTFYHKLIVRITYNIDSNSYISSNHLVDFSTNETSTYTINNKNNLVDQEVFEFPNSINRDNLEIK